MAISKIDPAGLDIGQIGGRRNLIINGAMQVAQRGTSSTNTSDGSYNTVDRWRLGRYALDDLSVTQEQSSDSPDGFSNSWKLTMTTPESALATDEFFYVHQRIEGQNLQHLAYGTSSAKTMTCSFWVKSSVTGTYAVNFHQNEASAYTLGRTYTINSANTWEYKTVEIPGDTSGNLDNDNGPALFVMFFLSAGSDWKGTDNSTWGAYSSGKWAEGHDVDVITQSGATWQITGVQLEVGSVATPFEHRSFGEELALCQRYYYNSHEDGDFSDFNGQQITIAVGGGSFGAAAGAMNGREYPVTMRATPAVTLYHQDGTADACYRIDTGTKITGVSALYITRKGFLFAYKASGFLTSYGYYYGYTANAEL